MRYDTIIIGGGLSGLCCGISLARQGQQVAIVSAGQSALHFCSGSFELYGRCENPLEGIASLPEEHPYQKMGVELTASYAEQVKEIFEAAAIKCTGEATRNHYCLTPIGVVKPVWLTLNDYARFESPDRIPWRKVALVNFEGYLDFYPQFIASGLAKYGVKSDIHSLSLTAFDNLRESSTEMRATNIARIMTGEILEQIAAYLNSHAGDAEALFLPAAFGLFDDTAVAELRTMVSLPLYFIPTMPASVPGVRTQIQLQGYFQKIGGTYLLGDNVVSGEIEEGRLKSVKTANHGDMTLSAKNFVIASGSFFSHGLIASQESIREPIFGLDIYADEQREEWYDKDLYSHQAYMGYGVVTDSKFRCSIGGRSIENLYAAGSILAHQNALDEGTGGGVAITTALFVADEILRSK